MPRRLLSSILAGVCLLLPAGPSFADPPLPRAVAAVLECPGIRSARVVKLPAAGQLPCWLAASAASLRRSHPAG